MRRFKVAIWFWLVKIFPRPIWPILLIKFSLTIGARPELFTNKDWEILRDEGTNPWLPIISFFLKSWILIGILFRLRTNQVIFVSVLQKLTHFFYFWKLILISIRACLWLRTAYILWLIRLERLRFFELNFWIFIMLFLSSLHFSNQKRWINNFSFCMISV